MAKIGIENLQDNVVALLNKSEDLTQLETNHKDSLVGAINEIIDGTANRIMIANSIGAPVVETDSIPEICNKIDSIEDKFRTNLNNIGIEVSDTDVISSMVDKLGNMQIITGIIPGEETLVHTIIDGKTEPKTSTLEDAQIHSFKNTFYSGRFRFKLSIYSGWEMKLAIFNKNDEGEVINSVVKDVPSESQNRPKDKVVIIDMPIEKGTNVNIHYYRVPSNGWTTGEVFKSMEMKCNINFNGKN